MTFFGLYFSIWLDASTRGGVQETLAMFIFYSLLAQYAFTVYSETFTDFVQYVFNMIQTNMY